VNISVIGSEGMTGVVLCDLDGRTEELVGIGHIFLVTGFVLNCFLLLKTKTISIFFSNTETLIGAAKKKFWG